MEHDVASEIAALSPARCILLAVHYVTESDIDTLHHLTPQRSDALQPELVLRILLTYLPETVEPSSYTGYVQEVATRLYLEQRDQRGVNLTPIEEISDSQAQKRVRHLHLLPLTHPSTPSDAPKDLLTHFLIHRAYQIDAQTGLLNLISQLITPFLDRSTFLRVWYISTILPLLRLQYEYYPQDGASLGLGAFETLVGAEGVDVLLSKGQQARRDGTSSPGDVGRDLRGLVGPWIYGDNSRKRRKLGQRLKRPPIQVVVEDATPERIAGAVTEREREDSWQFVFNWLVRTATNELPVTAAAVEQWNGPGDLDLGGYDEGLPKPREEDQTQLDKQFYQAAFAAPYTAETDDAQTIEAAHVILVRLAELMHFEPPPGLATSIEMLPKIAQHTIDLPPTSTTVFQPGNLLNPEHPLTSPKLETFSLLQLFVYSTYILASLNYRMAVVSVAELKLFRDDEQQLQTLQKIIHGLMSVKRDEEEWVQVRNKLDWLWHWGMDSDEEVASHGSGIFGKINRATVEKEILRALLSSSHYSLAAKIYILGSKGGGRLLVDEVEKVVLGQAMHFYDNASNGNKTRGGMKKASDLVLAFRPYFPPAKYKSFARCEALLAATHALSFYSLTLQHGVPFQPVNIRVSQDPIGLIKKLLEQNPKSYAELDNLVEIARNLVAACLTLADGEIQNWPFIERTPEAIAKEQWHAERRVTGMAIEAALNEGDFETAYSYVVNRLSPDSAVSAVNGTSTEGGNATEAQHTLEGEVDDISWRAAFQAGRYRPRDPSSVPNTGPAGVRRLEQRMELLTQALLLAPPAALPEVLGAWRRCEEEMTSLLAHESEEEDRINDIADKRLPGGYIQTVTVQPRRELGRGAVEETPMGLFDVARGAAAAFSRSTFPLRGAARSAGQPRVSGVRAHARSASSAGSDTASLGAGGSDIEERVRKRDIVANAVTGGLASGLGWVLGAKPVQQT